MNAKSIYDKLVNVEGVPSSILTYSDKSDCIIIEVQDYNKSVFKFAQKFFNGYKSVDIDYTNENKTIVWYNEVSEYSDRETIDSITRFYYDMKVKGLVESKESVRKSIKESTDDIITVKEFCFWGHSGNIVEIWTIDGILCDAFEVRNVGKSEYKNYEIHGWDCAKNTVIIYIKK